MNNQWRNKTVLIFGLGSYPKGSGVSALRYLHSQGAHIIVSDMKSRKDLSAQLSRLKGLKNIRYILGTHEIPLKGIDLIVKNPGVRADHPLLKEAAKRSIPVETDISLFLQATDNQIIGITGTRGKSTTTTLIHQLIRQKFPAARLGGNIRISPLTFVDKLKKGVPVVLELSSWQTNCFKTICRSPQVAVVTNIMVDHLNMYPTFGAYVADKKLIYKYQKPNDVVVLNKDNDYTFAMARDARGVVYFFSMKPLALKERGAFVDAKGMIVFQDGLKKISVLPVSRLRLPGRHNIANVLAAVCVAMTQAIPLKRIQKVLKEFKGIDSRLETKRVLRGVTFVNDTTATTPDATIAAINAFPKPPILICGGADKKLQYRELANLISKKIKHLILLPGTATDLLLPLIKKTGKNIVQVSSMREAVLQAYAFSRKGDVVLLSPGAASFGLFKNEFDRGDQFNAVVKSLK